jgi:VanZ family protein
MMQFWTRLKAWLPAIVWALLISGLSTDTFSTTNTSAFIVPLLRWLFPHASDEAIDLMHTILRKIAHLLEYFVLSILLARGLRGEERGWKLRWAIWAVILAGAYSALDEFHQLYVPSRGASVWDCLLDTAGAAAAQFALWSWKMSQERATTAKETVVSVRD